MPTDPIDRRAAKDAMIALVLGILKPKVTDPWIQEIESALDKLPALDADGRWEKLLQGLKFLAKSPVLLYSDKVSAAGVVAELNALLVPFLIASAPSAAERRPAEHVCDNRCLGEEGHHAWPSPTNLTSGDAAQRGE